MTKRLAACRLLSLLCFATTAFAETSQIPFKGRIQEGHLRVGGYGNAHLAESSFGTSATLTIPVEYFITDRLSVGTLAGLSYNSNATTTTSFSIGPSATRFFPMSETTAVLANLHLLYRDSGSGYFQAGTTVEFAVFLTPQISLGPALTYQHRFSSDEVSSADRVDIGADFTLYF